MKHDTPAQKIIKIKKKKLNFCYYLRIMVKYKNFVFVKFFVDVWKSNGYAGGIYT